MHLRSVLPLLLAGAALPALAQTDPPPAAAAPTLVTGLWCGSGPLHEFSLRLQQRDQSVEGELARRDRVRVIQGTIEGNVVRTQSTKVGALVLEHQGDELKITGGDGPLVLAKGQVFRRTTGAACTG